MTTLRDQWLSYMTGAEARSERAAGDSCYLPELCVMAFTGTDAREFLQGYLTCDTETLTADWQQTFALCNLKGRVLANGWCASPSDDTVEIIVHESLTSMLAEFFKPYLMFAKTELTSRANDALVFGADGPRVSIHSELDSARAAWNPDAKPGTWQANLIESGICLVTAATSASFLPQMLGLEEIGAVSFDKGCYLGQEVVARAQHRGTVKRRLQRLRWQGGEPPAGATLRAADGRTAGTLINAASNGAALGVVANDASYPLQERDTVLTQAG